MTSKDTTTHKAIPRWPLFLIAAPAAVAVWSGWVGLGTLCGFGIVHPLPGIAGGFRLDTAITLPVGVEAYGAYALGAWLAPGGVPDAARKFARGSAIGSLALGMLGQVVYHLLAAAHSTRAPWPVVVFVSCLPVVALGLGAALSHLLRLPEAVPEAIPDAVPVTVLADVPEADAVPALTAVPEPESVPVPVPEPAAASEPVPERAERTRRGRTRKPSVTDDEAMREFERDIAAGTVPGIREIRRRLPVGQKRAYEVRAYLDASVPVPA
jgi:hypothetical protein